MVSFKRGTPASDAYRGTSLMSKRTPLGPYRRPMPRVLGGSYGGGRFLVAEVPLHMLKSTHCHMRRGADTHTFFHHHHCIHFISLPRSRSRSRSLPLALSLALSRAPQLSRVLSLTDALPLQEYLAHKKCPPQGPYSRTIPRAAWWSQGSGGGSYERDTPVGGIQWYLAHIQDAGVPRSGYP